MEPYEVGFCGVVISSGPSQKFFLWGGQWKFQGGTQNGFIYSVILYLFTGFYIYDLKKMNVNPGGEQTTGPKELPGVNTT